MVGDDWNDSRLISARFIDAVNGSCGGSPSALLNRTAFGSVDPNALLIAARLFALVMAGLRHSALSPRVGDILRFAAFLNPWQPIPDQPLSDWTLDCSPHL